MCGVVLDGFPTLVCGLYRNRVGAAKRLTYRSGQSFPKIAVAAAGAAARDRSGPVAGSTILRGSCYEFGTFYVNAPMVRYVRPDGGVSD